jgi:hypothetical protein
MKATMLLCDAAQAIGGKLYILGGGWSVTGPAPVPSAVALYIQVPWDRSHEQHTFKLELLDADGNAVMTAGPDGEQPVALEGGFETGRPPGVRPGTPLDVSLAVNVPPLPLAPNGRFEWRMTIDGEARDEWRLAFSTRPAAPPGQVTLG